MVAMTLLLLKVLRLQQHALAPDYFVSPAHRTPLW
jgi:hypothetical protein